MSAELVQPNFLASEVTKLCSLGVTLKAIIWLFSLMWTSQKRKGGGSVPINNTDPPPILVNSELTSSTFIVIHMLNTKRKELI